MLAQDEQGHAPACFSRESMCQSLASTVMTEERSNLLQDSAFDLVSVDTSFSSINHSSYSSSTAALEVEVGVCGGFHTRIVGQTSGT